MPKFFVKSEEINQKQFFIKGTDVNHIRNVLRANTGDNIEVCNVITKKDYLCKIKEFEKDFVVCDIVEELKRNVESNVQVTVFQGIPKSDKMELIIQKSVELGVYDIVPVNMKRCVVKLKDKDIPKKIERWQKISEVASKQCGRNIIPEIKSIIDIKNICNFISEYDIVLVAYEKEEQRGLKETISFLKEEIKEKQNFKIGIVIGPEGGLEEQEVQMLQDNGAKIITLGKRILRTETVAFNMLSILMYELED